MKLRCLFGHDYQITAINKMRVSLFVHIDHNAGLDLNCLRCGKKSLDAFHGYWSEVEKVDPPYRFNDPENKARVKALIRGLAEKTPPTCGTQDGG